VHWKFVQRLGMASLINTVIVLSIGVPVVMTLVLQYPVADFIHGPYHLCNGRFEVYFNPMYTYMR
jgi:hypothetical protein